MNDVDIARSYISKAQSASSKGVEFSLSFNEYKKIITRKTCYYTGIKIYKATDSNQKTNTLTIDRIDSEKGYVTGNCVACSFYFNQLKSEFENSNNNIEFKDVLRGVIKLSKTLYK